MILFLTLVSTATRGLMTRISLLRVLQGERYKSYLATGLNNLATGENGGIRDESQLGSLETENVAVNLGGLNKAKSYLKNRNLMLVQRYTVGGTEPLNNDSTKTQTSRPFRLSGLSHIY